MTKSDNKQNRFPLVSVVIPLYNHEKFIIDALESVLGEDYPNMEIVIINDGSTDRSDEVVKSWLKEKKIKKKHIKYFSRENRGLSATLNELINRAEGEYIAVLASDDMLVKGGIKARVDYLMSNPDKLAVFGDCEVIDISGRKIFESGLTELYSANKKRLASDSGIKYEFICNWSVPGPVLMFRKSTVDIVGGYDETLKVEDWDFYLRLAARGAIGFVDQKVAKYRLHGNNLKDQIPHVWKEFLKILIKNFSEFSLPYRLLIICKIIDILRFGLIFEIKKLLGIDFRLKDLLRVSHENSHTWNERNSQ